jgi:hypothetical protein
MQPRFELEQVIRAQWKAIEQSVVNKSLNTWQMRTLSALGKWKHSKKKGEFLFNVKAMSPKFRGKFFHHVRKRMKDPKVNKRSNLWSSFAGSVCIFYPNPLCV